MTINRTTLLDLPLPVTGTESGLWGDITNNGLTQYLDIAIAGRTALTSANFTAGALTIDTTEGTSSATNIVAGSAQYATLYVSSLAANSTITAPSSNRAYRVVNADATYTLTIKASGQTGVTFPVSTSGTIVFNGTDYVLLGTYAPIFNVDNLRLDGNTLSSTNTDGNVVIAPNGTGDVQLDADTVRVGDSNANATITTNGTGDLILNTNSGTNSGSITIQDGVDGNIIIAPNGSGRVGIGTSSPTAPLTVVSPSNGVALQINGRSSDNLGGLYFYANNGTTSYCQITASASEYRVASQSTAVQTFYTNGSERVRIDSVGNVLIGGTAARGTTAGAAHLDLFNGTAPAGTLTNGISLYSSSGDFNFMDSAGNGYKVGFRNVPAVGTKTGSYTLATGDVGKYVQVGSGGSITIPDATFAEGDAVSIFNNTTGNITITCTITTAYIAGTDSDKASVTLATRGVATILFISSTVCVITGNVS